ncbi:MAG TPA: RNA methyltransferase [bacterium]|jgi:TrmH family RNA methyltransferase|nr:RNA methyltransferase [bacterium]
MPPFPSIQSVQNSMVKHAYSLKIPKKSKEADDFLCEGFHLVEEALKSGLRLRFIFGTFEAWNRPEGKGIFTAAHREKVKCFEVPPKIIAYISDTVTPQGILAVAQKIAPHWPEPASSPILCLNQVQDAGNLGTIFRSAEAFGAKGLFLTEGCCDPFNPKVVRASMGSLFRVPFVQNEKWETYQAWFKDKKTYTFALTQGRSQTLTEVKLLTPMAFWLGAEGSGLPDELTESCDERVSIPMAGEVESLNVAVAASLALFWAGLRHPVS